MTPPRPGQVSFSGSRRSSMAAGAAALVAAALALCGCSTRRPAPPPAPAAGLPAPPPVVSTAPPVRADARAAATLATGDYLSLDYIEALDSGRTPFEAGETMGSGLTLARVGRESSGAVVIVTGSFHESAGAIRVQSDGRVSLANPDPPPAPGGPGGKEPPTLAVEGRDRLTLTYPGFPPASFRHVGDAALWVAAHVFEGEWIDAEEHLYRFDAEGTLTSNDVAIEYSVCLDNVFCRRDIAYFGDRAYAFDIRGSVMTLSVATETEGGYAIAPAPELVLTRSGAR